MAALILSANPKLTNKDVMQILKESGDPIDSINPTLAGEIGTKLNASAAMKMASWMSSAPSA